MYAALVPAVVKINSAAVNALLRSPAGPVAQDLLRRGRRVEARAKQLCPVDEGRLRSSITADLVVGSASLACRVGTNVSYARFVHDGTGLFGPRHRAITPSRASVMRWPTRGTTSSRASSRPGRGRVTTRSTRPTGFVYARSTRGMKGTPFLRDALRVA